MRFARYGLFALVLGLSLIGQPTSADENCPACWPGNCPYSTCSVGGSADCEDCEAFCGFCGFGTTGCTDPCYPGEINCQCESPAFNKAAQ